MLLKRNWKFGVAAIDFSYLSNLESENVCGEHLLWVLLGRIMIGFAPLLDTDTFGYFFFFVKKRYRTTLITSQILNIDCVTGRNFWLTLPGKWHLWVWVHATDHWPAEHRKLCLSRFSLKPGEKARLFVCVFVLNISGQRRIVWTICHKGSLFLKIKDVIFSLI